MPIDKETRNKVKEQSAEQQGKSNMEQAEEYFNKYVKKLKEAGQLIGGYPI